MKVKPLYEYPQEAQMDSVTSEGFLRLMLADQDALDQITAIMLDKSPLFKMLRARILNLDCEVDQNVLLFLAAYVIKNPGQVTQYAHALWAMYEGQPIGFQQLSRKFTTGFCSQETLRQAWLDQKNHEGKGSDNWLDYKEAYVRF